jgi:hypothetical protein
VRRLPRYPIYVPSKGRWESGLTAKFLLRDRVPFKLVVEPQEADDYSRAFGAENVLVLPFSNLGQGVIPARNWIWDHARASGAERHWQFDDNIRRIERIYGDRGKIRCAAGPAVSVVEDFVDRYENVALAGLNYSTFAFPQRPPFSVNCHVYSAMLIGNDLPNRWRGPYNEDTDLCFQLLADGWCTVLVNAFVINKMATMKMKGGNTDEMYAGDGRLKMAKELERRWPRVATTKRRYGRPHHHARTNWTKFDTPLKLKQGLDLASMKPNEYGLRLATVDETVAPEVQDART